MMLKCRRVENRTLRYPSKRAAVYVRRDSGRIPDVRCHEGSELFSSEFEVGGSGSAIPQPQTHNSELRTRNWDLGLIVVVLACISATFAQQGPARPLSLSQALGIADRNNLDLVAARRQRAVSEAGVRIAGARPNPTFNFTALRDEPHESVFFD